MPNPPLLRVLAASSILALGGVACGGKVDSGVDPNKRASDLTPQEYEQVCDSVSSALEDATSPERQHELSCRVSGFIAAAVNSLVSESTEALRITCRENYNNCLAEDPAPNQVATMLPCDQTSTTCDITVGEVETCGNDALEWIEDIRARFPSCNEITAASFDGTNNDMDDAPPFPASCNIFDRC